MIKQVANSSQCFQLLVNQLIEMRYKNIKEAKKRK